MSAHTTDVLSSSMVPDLHGNLEVAMKYQKASTYCFFQIIFLVSFIIQSREKKERTRGGKKKKKKEATKQVPDFASDDFRLFFPTCAYCTLTADESKHRNRKQYSLLT